MALIQARVRARKVRIIVGKAREQHKRAQLVTKIASSWRRWLARSLARKYRLERWQRHIAVIQLQSFVRLALARILTSKLRHRRWRSKAPIMAIRVQKTFRGYRGRRKALETKEFQAQRYHQQQLLSIKIQSVARMRIAHVYLRKLKEEAMALDKKRFRSCITIQKLWRSELARHRMNEMRLELFKVRRRKAKASTMITRMIKRNQFRACIRRKVLHTRWLHSIASKIQRWYRQRVTLFALKVNEELRIKILRNLAAVTIQSLTRRLLAQLLLHQLKIQQDEVICFKANKSVIITCWCRVNLARTKVNRLRQERNERLKQQFVIQSSAATQIEAFWRGCIGKMRAQIERDKNKSQWKQMWSEEDQTYFYYNQVTGESRWRKPQQLLDLEPRPICSNCCYYDAQFECANCDEYFCNSCWDAVHFGGKRKNHHFRSLYDFYQKRIDYGDGEFPSLWPSEIEQEDHGL